jgi:hypothetical protein
MHPTRFSLLFSVAVVAVLGGFLLLPLMGQPDSLVVTPTQVVGLPLLPPPRRTGVFLDVWIQAYTPPQRGAVEAVVSLAVPRSDRAIEVGRFAVFPSQPFRANEASQQRVYRFAASAALAALPTQDTPLEVHVRREPLEAGVAPEGAQLTLGKAAWSLRP